MQNQNNKASRWILVGITALALVFCAFAAVKYFTYPTAEIETEIQENTAKAETLNAELPGLQQARVDKLAEMEADLSKVGTQGAELQKTLDELTESKQAKVEEATTLQAEAEASKDMQEACNEMRHEFGAAIRQLEDLITEGKSDYKIFYWTLDDGPTMYTEQFLEYAEERGAYLTFFTSKEANTQSKDEEEEKTLECETLRKEAQAGHSICNHSYSHQFAEFGNLYGMGIESFIEQVQKQEDWIYECTGFKTTIFRYPGGHAWAQTYSYKTPGMDEALHEMGYKWVDWSLDAMDNATNQPEASVEAYNIVAEAGNLYAKSEYYTGEGTNIAILLSHDWYYATLDAMKTAMPQLQEDGWLMLPLLPESSMLEENVTILYW